MATVFRLEVDDQSEGATSKAPSHTLSLCHYTIKQMTVVALYLFAHGPVFDF